MDAMNLPNTDIEGLDLEAGVARFGGNPKIYAKIIKAFIDNIGPHLDKLEGLTPEGLGDYAVGVHGVKGSLYGISANKEGDMARELEIAAKAGDYDKVLAGNMPFIDSVRELTEKLVTLHAAFESGAESRQKKPAPDKAQIEIMLTASRDFDVDKMQEALKELEKYEYEKDGDLVKWLSEQVTTFGYDKIEEKLAAIL
jgi:HPt (histidine-containing phosphotransfer) domain-containing protein